jgi:hypothetical protein
MKVEPDALDAIVVGTIGRQEAENDLAAEVGKNAFQQVTAVDAVIVEDDMNPSGALSSANVSETAPVQSGRGPARWCAGRPLAVSAVSGFVPV